MLLIIYKKKVDKPDALKKVSICFNGEDHDKPDWYDSQPILLFISFPTIATKEEWDFFSNFRR